MRFGTLGFIGYVGILTKYDLVCIMIAHNHTPMHNGLVMIATLLHVTKERWTANQEYMSTWHIISDFVSVLW